MAENRGAHVCQIHPINKCCKIKNIYMWKRIILYPPLSAYLPNSDEFNVYACLIIIIIHVSMETYLSFIFWFIKFYLPADFNYCVLMYNRMLQWCCKKAIRDFKVLQDFSSCVLMYRNSVRIFFCTVRWTKLTFFIKFRHVFSLMLSLYFSPFYVCMYDFWIWIYGSIWVSYILLN